MSISSNDPSRDTLDDFHMQMCIQDTVESMTDTQNCMNYVTGMLYEQSLKNPALESVTMKQIHDFCIGPNLENTNVGFFADLCKGTNEAYRDAFRDKLLKKQD